MRFSHTEIHGCYKYLICRATRGKDTRHGLGFSTAKKLHSDSQGEGKPREGMEKQNIKGFWGGKIIHLSVLHIVLGFEPSASTC